MRTRRIVIAAAAAAVLAAGAAVAVVSITRATAEPPGCDDIRAYQERYGEIETLGHGPRELTVLGDSYSAGDALTDRGQRWTDWLVQLDPELTVRLDAIPFTGFVNRGACGPNAFPDRIARAVEAADDILIVQGGLNDVYAEPENVARAAREVLKAAEGVDHVVVVGPIDAPGREGEREVDTVLQREAAARGLTYVSTLDWELPFGRDRVHPTAEGHRIYAQKVLDALAGAEIL
ncbi:SGNH/GDSL hydrolase family protein [Microbacterium rhizophilus]|uniref:SGNH/GDSL hydrolase family protein n=1 Tax=Microbacterium rhizophilus TaxID=3138934 RepID=UPI0031EE1032